jgi:hypothetical protein
MKESRSPIVAAVVAAWIPCLIIVWNIQMALPDLGEASLVRQNPLVILITSVALAAFTPAGWIPGGIAYLIATSVIRRRERERLLLDAVNQLQLQAMGYVSPRNDNDY